MNAMTLEPETTAAPQEQLVSRFLNVIYGFSADEHARMWCEMNRFQWPTQLRGLKPEAWDKTEDRREKMKLPEAKACWNVLSAVAGEWAKSREWNRSTMSPVQHATLWLQSHGIKYD